MVSDLRASRTATRGDVAVSAGMGGEIAANSVRLPAVLGRRFHSLEYVLCRTGLARPTGAVDERAVDVVIVGDGLENRYERFDFAFATNDFVRLEAGGKHVTVGTHSMWVVMRGY